MNTQPNKKLVEGLKTLCESDHAARKLFENFRARTKDARSTSVERAAWLAGADYGAMLAVFRQLDELGAGRFIPGRHGWKSRIEWAFSIRSLAQVAHGQKVKPEEVPADAVEDEGQDSAESGQGKLKHEFLLRDGFKLQIELPADLTDKEAERLAGFVKTLPF